MKQENSIDLLVGCYTEENENSGLAFYKFNLVTGNAIFVNDYKINNPSYFTKNADGTIIYVVSEEEDKYESAVSAIKLDKSKGNFTLLNSVSTKGAAPCYISIDNENKYLVTANYLGGSISVFKLQENGKIENLIQQIKFDEESIHQERQNQSHLHCVVYSPSYNHLFATDLGGDKIYKFDINKDTDDYLTPSENYLTEIEEGSGPRHLIFSENKFAYLISELSGEVKVFDFLNENLLEKQTVVSQYNDAEGSADIQIHPNGKYLYTSNRLEDDGLTIFKIDQNSGLLTSIGYQETALHPRNFVISPNGKYLLVASKDSHIIQVFEIDNTTGLLTNINSDIEIDLPVCIKFI